MKSKKIISVALVFIFVLLIIPIFVSVLFSNQSSGRIVINQEIEAPYLDGDKEFMLIYFGYVGCVKVCTPILHELDTLYRSNGFKSFHPSVDICFINLKEEIEVDQPDMFAKAFNPAFKGFYLTKKEIMSIDREFNLYFSRTLGDLNEMDHSDYLYLVQRTSKGQLILKNIYSTHPIKGDMISNDIYNLEK